MKLENIIGEKPNLSVIMFNPGTKSINFSNVSSKGEKSIIQFAKKSYDPTTFQPGNLVMDKFFENSIYTKYSTVEDIVEIITPATDDMVAKCSSQEIVMVQESPVMYKEISLPYFKEKIIEGNIKWIENIIFHDKEPQNVILNNPNFVLMKDYKTNIDKSPLFECLAIFKDFKYVSLREIDAAGLAIIKEANDLCVEALTKRYGINKEELRIYIHYHPSFYVFHIHFFHSNNITFSQTSGRAILLDDVIRNLTLKIDYYKEAVMTLQLNKKSDLYKRLVKPI